MIVLKPILKKTVWGGERIKEFYEGKLDEADQVGSLYTVACLENFSNEIMYPELDKGEKFYDYYLEHRSDFGYSDFFPFLIAWVDAKENLSIQVHPTESVAKKLGLNSGKSESWYFIKAPSSGYIYNGVANKKEFIEKVVTDEFTEVVDKLRVEENDYVYIESGTVHALTEGAFVFEVQEPTDVTYRFYDYERRDVHGNKRTLQELEAVNTMNMELKSTAIPILQQSLEKDYKFIVERKDCLHSYKNQTAEAQVITLMNKTILVNGYKVYKGQSLIIMPNEKIVFSENIDVLLVRNNTR